MYNVCGIFPSAYDDYDVTVHVIVMINRDVTVHVIVMINGEVTVPCYSYDKP